MKNFCKKNLSALLSATLAASAVFGAGDLKVYDGAAVTTSACAVQALPEEAFAAVTVSGGELLADGRPAGKSYGGVSLGTDNCLSFADGGRVYDLAAAQQELGVEVMYNDCGETVVTSPFSTARLIVRTDSAFDTCGAVTVEEKFDGIYLLGYPTIAAAYAAYLRISADDSVRYAEPDLVCAAAEEDDYSEPDYGYTPDDLGGWGAEMIGADDFCARLEERGELPEVVVAITDTGINYEHTALKDRLFSRGANFSTDDKTDAEDHNDHGSHCAGIVCSATPDNVKILPVKVLDDKGRGSVLNIYSGVVYAVDQGADVISISIGIYGRSNILEEAMDYARQHNVAVCVAAGNEYRSDLVKAGCALPICEHSITIGAMDRDHNCAYFSNWGNVDFAAPGVKILSSISDDENAYDEFSGTSMATPFAAACFADLRSYDKSFTVEEMYEQLKMNALDICETGYDVKSGWGMVNLRNFRFDGRRIEAPKADKAADMYDAAIEVRLTCGTSGAEIFYTLDGTVPTAENGTRYDGTSVLIEETSVLKAVAVLDGEMSRYEEYRYFIDDIDPEKIKIDNNGVLWKYDAHFSRLDLGELVESGRIPPFTVVAELAFEGHSELEEVILPPEVRSIRERAFANCTNLRRVTTDAEKIGESVFKGCTKLAEVSDENISRVGSNAFSDCIRLTDIDCTKLTEIPSRAFYNCSSLGETAFDMTRITSFGMECFKDSGIGGTIDAAAAESIGERAFENTPITEVLLPDTITAIERGTFKGCSQLTHISAPSLTRVKQSGLALDKKGFTPENAVRADIDFSRLEAAESDAFCGYVFDSPESFDSLAENDELKGFSGAYGSRLTFPNTKRVAGVNMAEDAENGILADMIELPAIESFRGKFGRCGAFVLGGGFGMAEDGVFSVPTAFFTYEESESAAEFAAANGSEYTAAPAVYCPEEHIVMNRGEQRYIRAYGVGEDVRGEWFRRAGEELLPVSGGDMPISFTAEEYGRYEYVYRLSGEDGVLCEREVTVDVIGDVSAFELEENGFTLLEDEEGTELDDGCRLYRASFTAEKGGRYRVNTYGARAVFSENGRAVFSGGNVRGSISAAYFEAGHTYDVTVVSVPDSGRKSGENLRTSCISVQNEDDERICISAVAGEYKVTWDNFKGNEDFASYVLMADHSGWFWQGHDFELVFDEPPHYGTNRYTIRGIGRYYGVVCAGEVELADNIAEGVWYDTADEAYSQEKSTFVPEKDGLYRLVICPSAETVERAVSRNIPLSYNIFDPMPSISGCFANHSGIEYFKVSSGSIDPGYSLSEDMFTSVIQMTAGKIYSITPGYTKNKFLITSGAVLGDCTFEYTRNYAYTGEKISPEITITAPDGTRLNEGEDYTVRVWKNEERGLMYAYVEADGRYPGGKLLTMAIEGGNAEVMENGDIQLLTGGEVKLAPFVEYKLVIPEDTFVNIDSKGTFCDVTISRAEEDFSYIADYRDNDVWLTAGTYDVCPASMRCDEMTYIFTIRGDLLDIAQADIVLKAPEYGTDGAPDIEVYYEGELLEKGTDYGVDESDGEDIKGVLIWGKNRFAGEVQVDYLSCPEPERELTELVDGENEVHCSPELTESMYIWRPEKSEYLFKSGDLSELLSLTITDENGRAVCHGELNRWTPVQCRVTAGETYLVSLRSNNSRDIRLDILGGRRNLNMCEIVCTGAVGYGEDEPQVRITDGDKLLAEGVDYVRLKDGGQPEIGPQAVFFEGIGDYYDVAAAAFHVYAQELPDEDVYELTENCRYRIGGVNEVPGIVSVLRFTAQHEGTAEYGLTVTTTGQLEADLSSGVNESPQFYRTTGARRTRCTSVFVYDGEGKYLGESDGTLVMDKGETRYIVVVTPYMWDIEETYSERNVDVLVKYKQTTAVPVQPAVEGDMNGDGLVNVRDVILLRRYFVGGWGVEIPLDTADIDKDGRVSARDIMLLRRAILN